MNSLREKKFSLSLSIANKTKTKFNFLKSKGNKKQGAKNIYFLNNSQTSNTPTLASPHQQQQQQLLSQTSKHHKNNLSNLSSSSNDTEIIMESGASRPNAPPARNLTAIRSSSHSNGGIVAPVIQPGQVVPAAGTVAPVEAKRHTQNIAAIAAQRRANKHHRELMQDIFENSSSSDSNHQTNNSNLKNFHSDSFVLTSSRMNGNGMDEYGGGGGGRYNLEKKNSVLTDGSLPGANGKVKKQVKIRDVVQFKLPDDNHYTEEMVFLTQYFSIQILNYFIKGKLIFSDWYLSTRRCE